MIFVPTIYLDVLLVQSLAVGFFLLRGTAKLTHSRLGFGRCVLAAFVSSLFSLLILLPPLPWAIQMLCKLGGAAITVTLAFGIHKATWLWQFGCFFCCTFLLAGLLLALNSISLTDFVLWENGYCYLDFSLFQLLLCTTLSYFLLHLCQFFHNRNHTIEEQFQVFLRLGDKTVMLPGLADTGNRLTDLFSGLSVIVCSSTPLRPVLQDIPLQKLPGYRLLPCTTVTAEGLMPLFRPDEIAIRNLSSGKSQKVDAMIGIGGSQDSAIFHPGLLL